MIFYNIKGLVLKLINNSFSHFFSNVGDHGRRKIGNNGSFSLRHDFLKVCKGKLVSILIVVGEVPSKFVF